MKLIVTIDTEEDSWGDYRPSEHTTENIGRIPALQSVFDEFYVTPVYLVTYPVAMSGEAVSILRPILDQGRCEIGTHCHAWNTPPFEEENTERNSMLSNLSSNLQFKKIKVLHETIQKQFGVEPVCFRSGRWGYNDEVAKNICRLGYKIDTSITPYTDWTKHNGPDYTHASPDPYRFSCGEIHGNSAEGEIIEIPVTVGFFQANFAFSNAIFNFIRRRPISYLGLIGTLHRINLLNKVWLSPEISTTKEMSRLTDRMMKNGYPILNMMFHSSALKAGLMPFVKTKEDEKQFLTRIREYLGFTRDRGIEPIKVSEAAKWLSGIFLALILEYSFPSLLRY